MLYLNFLKKKKVSNVGSWASHDSKFHPQGRGPGSQEACSFCPGAKRGLCCGMWGVGGGRLSPCWHYTWQAMATSSSHSSHRVWPGGLGWAHLHTACLPPCSLACRGICRTWVCSGRWHRCGSHPCPPSTRPRRRALCGGDRGNAGEVWPGKQASDRGKEHLLPPALPSITGVINRNGCHVTIWCDK